MDNQATINAANTAFQQAAAQAATEANAQSTRTPPPSFPYMGNRKGDGLVMKSAKIAGNATIFAVTMYGAFCIGQLIGAKLKGE